MYGVEKVYFLPFGFMAQDWIRSRVGGAKVRLFP